jgi:hypothetical protein
VIDAHGTASRRAVMVNHRTESKFILQQEEGNSMLVAGEVQACRDGQVRSALTLTGHPGTPGAPCGS